MTFERATVGYGRKVAARSKADGSARLVEFVGGLASREWPPTNRPPRHQTRAVPRELLNPTKFLPHEDPASWRFLGIQAADKLGHVRHGMTYSKDYGTSVSFSEKAGRNQFCEGPNEPAVANFLEMDPGVLDYQFQPCKLSFRRSDGVVIHKYPDVAIEFDDHSVVFGEIKSNGAWFAADAVRRPLARIDLALGSWGLPPMLRIKGEPYRSARTAEALRAAIGARLTVFDEERDALSVRGLIASQSGAARYQDVLATLGGKANHAQDKLYAMLLHRVVRFDLHELPSSETLVSAPRPARPYALRQLLNEFRSKAS